MPGKNEIDRIRAKTGIDKLETTQRKRLYREFVDHGGKTLEEEKGPPGKDQPKDRGPLLREQRTGIVREGAFSKPARTERPIDKKPDGGTQKTPPPKKRKRVRLRDLVMIYVKGFSLKVTAVRGNRFSERFMSYMRKDVKESLIDLGISMDSFLKGNGSIRKEIYRLSIGENSTYYEFMLRMQALYDEKEFAEIGKVIEGGDLPRPQHAPLFKKFFLRLYVLGQFVDLCKLYVDKSLEIQGGHGRIAPEIVPSMRAQLRKDLNVILGDLLLKLHIVLCRMDRTFHPFYSRGLDEFLGMTDKDKIGHITREERAKRLEELRRQREYLRRQQEEIHDKERVNVKMPKHVERGLPLIEASGNRYAFIHEGEQDDPLPLMSDDDKMRKAYICFDVFDNEYSFILTTGKINFNVDYRYQKKVDIKEDLNRAYLLLNDTREEVREYLDIMRELKKTGENMRLTIHQKSSMLDALQKRRSVASKSARAKIADAMKAIEGTLSVVIGDYNASKRLLQNPEESLYFEKAIDGDKKLHGRKTIEAVVEAFLYASAFAFLLMFGELSGSGLAVEPAAPARGPSPVPARSPADE